MSNGETVRDATFAVMRHFGMTTIFGNPGSTEIPFLTDLPPDINFVLGLHEGPVVGMATGYAIARGQPSFVNLHTAAGLGNAINAIANARDCGAPLVIVVGQQDRRQLAFEPFLTGRSLERLAGENLVWSALPVRAQDVPGAIGRAYYESLAHRGPALVVVPMGDWLEPADELAAGTPAAVNRSRAVAPEDLGQLADLIDASRSPAFVVGPGSDSREGWDAMVALTERLRAPVWQESFVRRAGFPQDHPLFAGFLPWQRSRMRRILSEHDLVVAVGTGAFRLYLLDEYGPLVEAGTRVAVLTEVPAEAYRSPCGDRAGGRGLRGAR
jgi:benzoylformate decarboxylase